MSSKVLFCIDFLCFVRRVHIPTHGGLQIHLANPLERADEEGVDRHQFPGVVDLNLAFAKLGAEAF